MKALWRVLVVASLLCVAISAWLLSTSAAGARMLAAAQLFVLGALAAGGCAGVAAVLGDPRKQKIGVALVLCYGLGLLMFLTGIGNVR